MVSSWSEAPRSTVCAWFDGGETCWFVLGAKHGRMTAVVIHPLEPYNASSCCWLCRSLTSCRYSTRLRRLRFWQLSISDSSFIGRKYNISVLSDRASDRIHTSWASQGADSELNWRCPAQFYMLGCDCLARCWPCIKQQTWGRHFMFSFFVREVWSIQLSEKYKFKSGHNSCEKREEKRRVSPLFAHTCGSNLRSKFQIEGR